MKESKPCPCGYDTAECTTCQNAALDAALTAIEHNWEGERGPTKKTERILVAMFNAGAKWQAARAQPAGEAVACPDCKGTGSRDSGGSQPWGEPIMVPCDCQIADPPAQVQDGWRLVRRFVEIMKDCYEWPDTTSSQVELANLSVEAAEALAAAPQAKVPDASSYAKLHTAATAAMKYANEFNLGDYQGRFNELRAVLAAAPQPKWGE